MFTHDAYLLTLDPFAVQLSESFGIRWYGLAYLVGFLGGYLTMRWFSRRGISPLPVDLVFDFVCVVALGTIIGGRIGYCLFYSPDLFLTFRSSFPFWGVLAIHEGGMASHGGIIGIILACLWYARQHRLPALHLIDLTTLGGTLGVFFGRIANFINGELVGRPSPPGYAFGVKFPQDMYQWLGSERDRLANLTDVVPLLGTAASDWTLQVAQAGFNPTAYDAVATMTHRIVAAVQSGNTVVATTLAPHLTTRYPSQLIQAALEGLLLFIVLMALWRVPRRPGLIAASFIVLYAAVRIIGEHYRMPDVQIGFQLFGLTRGQWLSIVMLVIGIGLWVSLKRRAMPALGGWGRTPPQEGA